MTTKKAKPRKVDNCQRESFRTKETTVDKILGLLSTIVHGQLTLDEMDFPSTSTLVAIFIKFYGFPENGKGEGRGRGDLFS